MLIPKIILTSLTLFISFFSFAQNDTINAKDVGRILNKLASDSMKGRGNGNPELLTAAKFIGDEFEKYGLQVIPGKQSYFFPFRPFGGSTKVISDILVWNEEKLPSEQFMYVHPVPGNYKDKGLSDFKVVRSRQAITDEFIKQTIDKEGAGGRGILIWTSRKQSDKKSFFPKDITMPAGGLKNNILLVYADSSPDTILLSGFFSHYNNIEYNVAGILPGKTKPDEIILFGAHYDHEGVYPLGKDSIMNGANDNASGTTALLTLANYFAKRNDNERTLMFCAFSAEELGLVGSREFIGNINPVNVKAMINIEMIAVAQFGKNTIFITGEKYSDLPAILKKGFTGTSVKLRKEPDLKKKLFERSDNFNFAKLGIPAHTIQSSDDNDPCYHKPCDEIKRADVQHMTTIIKSIARAVRTLVNGTATPGNVKLP